MDEPQAKLLQMVADGVIIFEPLSRTSKELLRFQEMARLLLRLETDGLLHRCLIIESEIAGERYIDRIHIPRGLTSQGKAALADHARGT